MILIEREINEWSQKQSSRQKKEREIEKGLPNQRSSYHHQLKVSNARVITQMYDTQISGESPGIFINGYNPSKVPDEWLFFLLLSINLLNLNW